jgi:hypothetical protein
MAAADSAAGKAPPGEASCAGSTRAWPKIGSVGSLAHRGLARGQLDGGAGRSPEEPLPTDWSSMPDGVLQRIFTTVCECKDGVEVGERTWVGG